MSAWKKVINTEEQDAAKLDYGRVEEQPVESGPVLEEGKDSIATALQEAIAIEGKKQIENALLDVLDVVEEVVEQFFCVMTVSAQGGIRTVVSTPWNTSSSNRYGLP